MDLKEIHPSHKMEYNDYGSDNHDDHSCKICHMSTCFMCRPGEGPDDDELQAPCWGFPWTEGIYSGDTLIGRKSGTGWPKGGNSGYSPLLRPGA